MGICTVSLKCRELLYTTNREFSVLYKLQVTMKTLVISPKVLDFYMNTPIPLKMEARSVFIRRFSLLKKLDLVQICGKNILNTLSNPFRYKTPTGIPVGVFSKKFLLSPYQPAQSISSKNAQIK